MGKYVLLDVTSKYAPQKRYANLTGTGEVYVYILHQWCKGLVSPRCDGFSCLIPRLKRWVFVHVDRVIYKGKGVWKFRTFLNTTRGGAHNVWRDREKQVLREIEQACDGTDLKAALITQEDRYRGFGDILIGQFENKKDGFAHKQKIRAVVDVCGCYKHTKPGRCLITRHKDSFEFYKRMNELQITLCYAYPFNDLELYPSAFSYLVINKETLQKYFTKKNGEPKKSDIYLSYTQIGKAPEQLISAPSELEKIEPVFMTVDSFLARMR